MPRQTDPSIKHPYLNEADQTNRKVAADIYTFEIFSYDIIMKTGLNTVKHRFNVSNNYYIVYG